LAGIHEFLLEACKVAAAHCASESESAYANDFVLLFFMHAVLLTFFYLVKAMHDKI
jgi:hypothetical protein